MDDPPCCHAAAIADVTPSALSCEECLKSGSRWLHLRLCRTCGHEVVFDLDERRTPQRGPIPRFY